MCPELMPCREQFLSKLGKIINLAVEHHGNRSVFIKEWLVTVGKINDRQAAMCQTQPGFNVDPALIRTTMKLDLVHTGQQPFINGPLFPGIEYPCYATHG
jgi:hypothetical protein